MGSLVTKQPINRSELPKVSTDAHLLGGLPPASFPQQNFDEPTRVRQNILQTKFPDTALPTNSSQTTKEPLEVFSRYKGQSGLFFRFPL